MPQIEPTAPLQTVRPSKKRDINVKYPWLWFQFHGDSLGNDTATQFFDRGYAQNNGQASALFTDGLVTVTNADAGMWDDEPGRYVGTGASYIKDTTDAIYDFCTPDPNGGLLINFTVNRDANPTNTEGFVSYSDQHANGGGWAVLINSSGDLQCIVKPPAGAADANVVVATIAAIGTDRYITVYFDWKNLAAIPFIQGVLGNAPNAIPTPLPELDQTSGFVVSARSGLITSTELCSHTAILQIENMQIFKCTSDESANIQTIANEYMNNPNAIPKSLVNP